MCRNGKYHWEFLWNIRNTFLLHYFEIINSSTISRQMTISTSFLRYMKIWLQSLQSTPPFWHIKWVWSNREISWFFQEVVLEYLITLPNEVLNKLTNLNLQAKFSPFNYRWLCKRSDRWKMAHAFEAAVRFSETTTTSEVFWQKVLRAHYTTLQRKSSLLSSPSLPDP